MDHFGVNWIIINLLGQEMSPNESYLLHGQFQVS